MTIMTIMRKRKKLQLVSVRQLQRPKRHPRELLDLLVELLAERPLRPEAACEQAASWKTRNDKGQQRSDALQR
jgi:hypothetical protein